MRTIDAEVLKAGLEEDGHLTPYIEEFIDACPTVGEWISVKDRLPEPNTMVLCWREFMNGPIILDYGLICGNRCFYDFDEDGFPEEVKPEEVTHWMPLPEPPKEE